MSTEQPTSKPWYQSKIILLSLSSVAVYGGTWLYNYLSGAGVTPEQIDVIRTTQPQIADAVEEFKTGQNVLNTVIGLVIPSAIAIARRWFTNITFLQ